MPELRLLDSREPERLAELEHLLAGLGLPGWRSGAPRRITRDDEPADLGQAVMERMCMKTSLMNG